MKTFVEAINRNGEGFRDLQQKFSHISDANMKEGIFVEPHINPLKPKLI
jgi:hypothetical protein